MGMGVQLFRAMFGNYLLSRVRLEVESWGREKELRVEGAPRARACVFCLFRVRATASARALSHPPLRSASGSALSIASSKSHITSQSDDRSDFENEMAQI